MKTNKSNRWLVKLLALCIVLLSVAGVTLSYLIDESNDVVNTFVPGKVDIAITEENPEITDDGTYVMKKNAAVLNRKGTDIIDAYVRAKVIPIWRDGNGSVIGAEDYDEVNRILYYESADTTIKITIKADWIYVDGTFYYTKRLAPGASAPFVDRVEVIENKANSPRIAALEVQILAEGIQADGMVGNKPAVEDAWGVVTVGSDGKLVENTNN